MTTMGQPLLSLPLRNKRDSLIARQRTRQLAGLLGYDLHEQAGIAAGVFAVAWQIQSLRSPVQLCFHLEDDTLRIVARAPRQRTADQTDSGDGVLCLERPVPARMKMGSEDLAWALNKLDQITPAHMYEEVYRLNQELLATMQALESCQAQLNMMGKGEKPSAA
jgi:hypothetical protein